MLLPRLSACVPILTLALPSIAGGAPSAKQGFALHPDVELDRFGRPVREDGRPVIYPWHPLEAMPPAKPAGREAADVPVLPAADFEIRLEWYRAVFGSGIGDTGLSAVDLGNDGYVEIVAAGNGEGNFGPNNFWYVLARNEQGAFEQVWISPIYTSGINSLRCADTDGDGRSEVLVGSGGRIEIYDGSTRALLRTISTSAPHVLGLSAADVDGDGEVELVFVTTDNGLYIYGLDGSLEYRGTAYSGWDCAVGNVDDDADLEIVVGNGGGTGYVLNGRTREIEWAYGSGFGNFVRLGDVDGDGRDEIVGAHRWYRLLVFDADLKSPKYEVSTSHDVDALRVADVDGDSRLEILYGDGQWGSVHVLNGENGTLLWRQSNPEHGVTDVAIGDVDGDGVNELIWGAGYSSTGPDYLYVVDTQTRVVEWQSYDISGPFYALAHGDVDDDARPELLYGCYRSKSGYDDGLYFVHDAATHELEYLSPPPTGSNWTGLWRIRHAQLDDDPQHEILITTSRTYTGLIFCYDGLTHAKQWEASARDGQSFRSLQVADVDLDGAPDVVAAVYREHTGAPGTYLFLFDGRTGAERWHSVSLGSYWASLSLLRVANVDADPQPEMLVAEYGGPLFIYDGLTRLEQLQTANLNLTALDTFDRDGDGISEIIVGDAAGAIRVLDAATGNPIETIGTFGARIDGLAVLDFLGGPGPEYVFAAANRINVLYRRLDGSTQRWTSGPIGYELGQNDSLVAADIDGDGNVEIVVNIGKTGLQVYEIPDPPCPGDLNRDNSVGQADLATLLADYGCSGGDCVGDVDGDGDTDQADLAALLAHFGERCL